MIPIERRTTTLYSVINHGDEKASAMPIRLYTIHPLELRKSPRVLLVLTITAYYLLIGCAFGVAFFLRGYAVIAPEARGASIATRLIWVPAAIALWPLLARKWQANRQPSPD